MFVRVKKVGPYQYLQIAQNRREGKRVKQSVIATLGRLDKLTASGAIDQLLRSAARFAERVMVLSEHSRDAHDRPDANVVSIGPALIFERLWRETGWRRHGTEDFGPSRFGRNPRDKGFTGRRIDVFGRSIARHAEQATEDAVLKWVRSKRRSAQHIVTRPVVVLYPERECGRVIWDPQADIREQGDGNRATDEIQTGSTSTIACAASSSL